jgi:hypothetical protein
VPDPLSHSEVLALSERLREAATPSDEDIELLGHVLIRFNRAMGEVADQLRALGLSPTTRLKTSGTIVDKLKRQPHLHLGNIRDLAGARVVFPMSLSDQDEVAKRIAALWGGIQVIDRRAQPSFGYRAVHLVPKIDGCSVEIQLRTVYQHTWAQLMETFGDMWGREIRYGGAPTDPNVQVVSTSALTRSQVVELWITVSDHLSDLAQIENSQQMVEILAKRTGIDVDPLLQTLEENAKKYDDLKAAIKQLASFLASQDNDAG